MGSQYLDYVHINLKERKIPRYLDSHFNIHKNALSWYFRMRFYHKKRPTDRDLATLYGCSNGKRISNIIAVLKKIIYYMRIINFNVKCFWHLRIMTFLKFLQPLYGCRWGQMTNRLVSIHISSCFCWISIFVFSRVVYAFLHEMGARSWVFGVRTIVWMVFIGCQWYLLYMSFGSRTWMGWVSASHPNKMHHVT